MQKPEQYAADLADTFKASSVVEAYRHRPPYPAEIFTILKSLLKGEPGHVLDIGCGTGNIARYFVEHVERLDAVDFSQQMIAKGKTLPNGNHPHLRWLYGRAEDVALEPPYSLIIAGESLHWMDWNIVLPRFQRLLVQDGYLALVGHPATPDPWSVLGDLVPRYRTDGGYQAYNLIEELEKHGLFQKIGEQKTAPISFTQSIADFIESYHSRSMFSRERMGQEQARTFDQEARKLLLAAYPDGVIQQQVTGIVEWGYPKSK